MASCGPLKKCNTSNLSSHNKAGANVASCTRKWHWPCFGVSQGIKSMSYPLKG
uniref:Uncharacterized protein n=1 Tax=Anguilla anguilla TaxID=7936 RepID=A0A0E9WBV0_ANGAN